MWGPWEQPLATGMFPSWLHLLPAPSSPSFSPISSCLALPLTPSLLHQLTDGAVKGKLGQDPGKGRDVGKASLLLPPPAPLRALLHHSLWHHYLTPFSPRPAGCKAHTCCSVKATHPLINEAPATPHPAAPDSTSCSCWNPNQPASMRRARQGRMGGLPLTLQATPRPWGWRARGSILRHREHSFGAAGTHRAPEIQCLLLTVKLGSPPTNPGGSPWLEPTGDERRQSKRSLWAGEGDARKCLVLLWLSGGRGVWLPSSHIPVLQPCPLLCQHPIPGGFRGPWEQQAGELHPKAGGVCPGVLPTAAGGRRGLRAPLCS